VHVTSAKKTNKLQQQCSSNAAAMSRTRHFAVALHAGTAAFDAVPAAPVWQAQKNGGSIVNLVQVDKQTTVAL